MMNKALFTSNSDIWETPQEFFEELNTEFHFTLDACANKDNAKCERYFSEEENGLSKSWGGEVVFCNPPYSNISEWVKKCYYESIKPGTIVVLLIPARTDTRYFHDYIYHRSEIRFVSGRLKFSGKGSAPFPSMVVIFRSGGINELQKKSKSKQRRSISTHV